MQFECLSHEIKVHELNNFKRFEAAGLGIMDVSQIEYYGSIGIYFEMIQNIEKQIFEGGFVDE